MKAIKITQEIKNKNSKYGIDFINNAIGTIIGAILPSKFYVTEPVSGGYETRTDLHEVDGWQDVIIPAYNAETHKLGTEIIEVGEDFTYQVIEKTQQEIQNEIISQSEANRAILINQKSEEAIINEAQGGDDEKALENQDLFPMWKENFDYEVGFKCQDFNENNELKLYKTIQAHTSQAGWRPKDVPALFTLLEFSNGVEVWAQPTGGDGKYPNLDPLTGLAYVVEHNGFLWTNNVPSPTLNVWEPGVYGWTKGEAV